MVCTPHHDGEYTRGNEGLCYYYYYLFSGFYRVHSLTQMFTKTYVRTPHQGI